MFVPAMSVGASCGAFVPGDLLYLGIGPVNGVAGVDYVTALASASPAPFSASDVRSYRCGEIAIAVTAGAPGGTAGVVKFNDGADYNKNTISRATTGLAPNLPGLVRMSSGGRCERIAAPTSHTLGVTGLQGGDFIIGAVDGYGDFTTIPFGGLALSIAYNAAQEAVALSKPATYRWDYTPMTLQFAVTASQSSVKLPDPRIYVPTSTIILLPGAFVATVSGAYDWIRDVLYTDRATGQPVYGPVVSARNTVAILVDSEIMITQWDADNSGPRWSADVRRGACGSSPVAHSAGAPVVILPMPTSASTG